MTEQRFDDLLNELANEPVDAAAAEAAKARVWSQLENAPPAACAAFRADLPDYAAGRLLESRRLLARDHLSRCAGCRQALQKLQSPGQVVEMPAFRAPGAMHRGAKWAIAAGLAAVSLWAGRDRLDTLLAPAGPRATVESVQGPYVSVPAGARLGEGEVIRTGSGSRAVVRLADGSLVEMNERAELRVHGAWSGQTVQLAYGDVILQAAKQRRGRLHVTTRDADAAVKGTIFAVSTGVAGSLVAVVEGSVEVEQAGLAKKLLKRGEHAATSDVLAEVDAREAVAWSQNAEQYYALLSDLQKIEQAVMNAPSTLRTQSRLLPLLPAEPVFYGAAPNVGVTLARAVEDRLRESTVLREWWATPSGQEMKQLLEAMQAVAVLVGDEVAFMLAPTSPGSKQLVPLVLAEIKPGQNAMLKALLEKSLAGPRQEVFYQLTQTHVLLSDSAAHLAQVLPLLGRGVNSPFATELQARYQRGAGWLAAVNFAGLLASNPLPVEAQALGFNQVRHLVFEQRPTADNEALLSFSGARTGVASWLAAPAAAGSAEYASSDALMAISAVTRNPRQAFDELMNQVGRLAPGALAELRQFEQKTGVSIANDLASALGTDLTFSLETPALPVPGWVLAAECYRPEALEATIKRLVDALNAELPAAQRLTLASETSGGRTWSTLKHAAPGTPALHWTYDRGYWLLSMDRAVVTRAIATRSGGFPLVRSARFLASLPRGSSVHQSAFVWLNVNNALAQMLAQTQSPALKSVLENREPVLLSFHAQTERIQASSRTRLSSLLIDFALAGMNTVNVPSRR